MYQQGTGAANLLDDKNHFVEVNGNANIHMSVKKEKTSVDDVTEEITQESTTEKTHYDFPSLVKEEFPEASNETIVGVNNDGIANKNINVLNFITLVTSPFFNALVQIPPINNFMVSQVSEVQHIREGDENLNIHALPHSGEENPTNNDNTTQTYCFDRISTNGTNNSLVDKKCLLEETNYCTSNLEQSDNNDPLCSIKTEVLPESTYPIEVQNTYSEPDVSQAVAPVQNEKLYSKLKRKSRKDFCSICFEEVSHFSRHLFRKHSEHETVKKIFEMRLNSGERRKAIVSFRKKGNFILKVKKRKFKAIKKSLGSNPDINHYIKDNYFPCVNCLGFYKRNYLWRHRKTCESNWRDKKTGPRKHLSESQTFLAATGLLGNYLNNSRIKEEVFNIMRADSISYVAKTDALICLFGESFISRYRRKQMNIVVSNKMRELGRLKIALTRITTIKSLIDILTPEYYDSIVAASKVISGYDSESRTFKAPTLALHMGTTLKFLCDIAKEAVVTNNPLFLHLDGIAVVEKIDKLLNVINNKWNNDFSDLNKIFNERKYEKTKLLLLTEDVKTLNIYLKTVTDEALNNLENNKDIESNYKLLTECILVLVLIFNYKRIGEVQFLDLRTYENSITVIQEEHLNALTKFEKEMCPSFKHVVVFSENSEPVTILFTKRMQTLIDKLLTIRKSSNIVHISNIYLFADPDSKDRWMSSSSVLRKYANKCGAKKPDLLLNTKFRKQIAIISQILSCEKDDIEQIARFMGHTENFDMEFNRITEDVDQIAKVAKVLLLLNLGKGAEFKGMRLSEIEVAEDIVEYDDHEEESIDADQNGDTENSEKHIENIDSHFEKQDLIEKYGCKNTSKCLMTRSKLRKPVNYVRWPDKNKKLVLEYFKDHIRTKTAPKKHECIGFIAKNKDLFHNSDYIRIKTLVYNTYRDK